MLNCFVALFGPFITVTQQHYHKKYTGDSGTVFLAAENSKTGVKWCKCGITRTSYMRPFTDWWSGLHRVVPCTGPHPFPYKVLWDSYWCAQYHVTMHNIMSQCTISCHNAQCWITCAHIGMHYTQNYVIILCSYHVNICIHSCAWWCIHMPVGGQRQWSTAESVWGSQRLPETVAWSDAEFAAFGLQYLQIKTKKAQIQGIIVIIQNHTYSNVTNHAR